MAWPFPGSLNLWIQKGGTFLTWPEIIYLHFSIFNAHRTHISKWFFPFILGRKSRESFNHRQTESTCRCEWIILCICYLFYVLSCYEFCVSFHFALNYLASIALVLCMWKSRNNPEKYEGEWVLYTMHHDSDPDISFLRYIVLISRILIPPKFTRVTYFIQCFFIEESFTYSAVLLK